MPLSPGVRLGPYELIAAIGAGGMGEVYRGRDAALNRDVAIKVLPEALSGDAERLARFKREAQVLASLNHSNIAHVYGFEGATLPDGSTVHFLAMEMVEGEDLAERLKRGAIPVGESIAIANQIAEGLEEAHEHGVIHRDLKPANVKVTPDGKVKILDFGLAKALEGDPTGSGASSPLSHSPTMSRHMTEAGMIMGTAAYMSPEQARGKTVDKRSDIWAFGVVLYEMLTGERLFSGETVSDVLAAVLTREPNLLALPAATPGAVRQLLLRCLQKDPRKRLRDIGDARPILDGDAKDAAFEDTGAGSNRPGRFATIAPWLLAGVSILALVATLSRRATAPPTAGVSFNLSPSDDRTPMNPALSADGTVLVYEVEGVHGLHVRRLSDLGSRELPGTENARQPFLSPDGKWVGFLSEEKIKKVAIAGGEALVVANDVPDSPGAAFVSNDRILFTRGWLLAALMSVGADGGPVTQASTLDKSAGERGHWWPRALPDGRHVLFTIWYAGAGLQSSKVGVLDLETGKHRALFPGAMAQYGDGHLLFYRAGQYHVMPFDPVSLAATGESHPVLPEAFGLTAAGDSVDPLSLSANGSVAYMAGQLHSPRTLTWVERGGRQTLLPLTLRISGADLAPNDQQIAIGRPEGGASNVWIYDVTGAEQRVSSDSYSWNPVWHPDGRRLAYVSLRKGDFDAAVQTVGAPAEMAADEDSDEEPVDWLPDGRLLVRATEPGAGMTEISFWSQGSRERTPLVRVTGLRDGGRVSPDGRWLALCTSTLGSREYVYVRSLTGPGDLQRVTPVVAEEDCGIAWSAGTRELLVQRPASVSALAWEERGGRFVITRETEFAPIPARTALYGVTRDGKRLLVGIRASSASSPKGLNVHVGPVSTWSRATR